MKVVRAVACAAAMLAMHPAVAGAQSDDARFQVGAQVAAVSSSEFDATDVGFGGRLAWYPVKMLGLEGELNLYPGDFPGGIPFSASRVEGLFGVTARALVNRVRPFARLRPGFLRMGEAPQPIACILIFPPPLSCELASGATLFALDVGGGVEFATSARTFVRIDLGDRLLRYPGPVFDRERVVRERPFFSHEFRFAAGGGVSF